MSNTIQINQAVTRQAIVALVNAAADYVEAKTKAVAVAEARFDGLVKGVHYLLTVEGIAPGAAPFSVHLDVLNAVRDQGPRPVFTGTNPLRLNWQTAVVEAIVAKWGVA